MRTGKEAGKSLSVALVAVSALLSLGFVYMLSTTMPAGRAENGGAVPPAAQSSVPVERREAASGPKTQYAYTPDLTKVDPAEFLDPIDIGHPASDFTAKTAEGKTVKLSDYKGKKNVVMVFYQGSFCPHCGAQLENIQSHLKDYRDQDAEILAISADDAAHAQQSIGEHGLSFAVIPDADRKIIKQYGMGNIQRGGIAWPSVYIVDKKGLVQLAYADPDGHRMHSNEILPHLSKLTGKPAPKLTYEQ